MSCAIAMIILRKFSACLSSWLSVFGRRNFESLRDAATMSEDLFAEEGDLGTRSGVASVVFDGVVSEGPDDPTLRRASAAESGGRDGDFEAAS